MPIYAYQCENCDHQMDKLQKMSDEPLKTCPECGQDSLRKMVTAAAFKLKGSGWYETDFKDKKSKKDAKSTSSDSDSGDKKSSDNESKSTSSSESSASTTETTNKPSTSTTSSKSD